MSIRPYIEAARTPLTTGQMIKAMTIIMNGDAQDRDIADFLTILAERGETAAEITGAAKVLRSKVLSVNAPQDAVDCCGTGGDGINTYNISTAVALICAAYGIPMAKHGNRSASSQSGAADVLESLGVNLNMPQDQLESTLHDLNFCFLMAPQHHTAMKHVASIRKQLGFRTIFNLLGPLANPANTKRQLIGVYNSKWLEPMAKALNELGTQRAWLVHGHDGMDEITLTDKTDITILNNGNITSYSISPEDFNLPHCTLEDLRGSEADVNAEVLKNLLKGEPSAYRNIVLANAAAVIAIHEDKNIKDLKMLTNMAAEIIDSGKALTILENYIEASKRVRS